MSFKSFCCIGCINQDFSKQEGLYPGDENSYNWILPSEVNFCPKKIANPIGPKKNRCTFFALCLVSIFLIISFEALAKLTASISFLMERPPGVFAGSIETIFFNGVEAILKYSATSSTAAPVILKTTAISSEPDLIPKVEQLISR